MDKQVVFAALATAAVTIGDKVKAWSSAVADLAVYWSTGIVPAGGIEVSAHLAYQGLIYAPLVALGAYFALRAKAAPAPTPTTEEKPNA